MKIVVYKCITGGYDTLIDPIIVNPDIDYICYTDDINLKSDIWQIRLISDNMNLSNVRLLRYYKLHPHILFPDYDISIWIDGNIDIISNLTELINETNNSKCNIFIPKHPLRDCIYDEAKELNKWNKGDIKNINKQVELYNNEQYPKHYGLTLTNIIIRKHNEYSCILLMNMWWNMILHYSYRDQMSLYYCIWKLGYTKLYVLQPYLNGEEIHKSRDFQYVWKHIKNDNYKSILINKSNLLNCQKTSKTYCVIIPIYNLNFKQYEIDSLNNAYNMFNHDDIYIISPNSLNVENKISFANVIHFNDEYFKGIIGYNKLCTSSILYKTFKQYDYMLILQTDAFTIHNNIEYFINLDYDYYGAPWKESDNNLHNGQIVGNGGYSLRKISTFLNICLINEFNNISCNLNEDSFFCVKNKDKLKICPYEIAIKFAWELEYNVSLDEPMGEHKLIKYNKKLYDKLTKLIINNQKIYLKNIGYTVDTLKYKDKMLNFMKKHGIDCNLDNPRTIQEKLAWLNIYECPIHKSGQPLKSYCADKIKVHEYCKEILGKDICIPILQIYDNVADINWDELPKQFVIKCNHGSGMNIICKDKSKINIKQTITKLTSWIKDDFTFRNGFEAHYHDILHKIFIEEYKNDGHNDLIDYKFLCFNGVPIFCQTIGGRNDNTRHLNYYDMDYNFVNLCRTDFPNNISIHDAKPVNFELMKQYAKKLTNVFKFVRIDFYEIDNKVYLGELTFTPGCFIFQYKNTEDNKKIGDLLKL